MNEKISKFLTTTFDKNLTIYSKKTGIRKWLSDELYKVAELSKDSINNLNEMQATSMADYWLTQNQKLNNYSGWDSNVFKTGKRSLKIVNDEGMQSRWNGPSISLENPTNTFEFEGWSKSDSIVSNTTKLYAIDYHITFVDNTTQWYLKNLKFKKRKHDWEQVKTKIVFDKKVKAIEPNLLFYGGKGTVWFDDIKAFPIIDGIKKDNIIPNAGAEIQLTERKHLSYSYNEKEWSRIQENMFSLIDYLSASQAENKYLLLTPFWHTEKKSAYPQKVEYESLVNKVKKYCTQKNVKAIDASYILNTDDFGVYSLGSVRDKIDVLHFGVRAHEELAKYILENL